MREHGIDNGPMGKDAVCILAHYNPDQLKQHVSCVTVQELVAEIEPLGVLDWFAEFKRKYGLEIASQEKI